jgi:hypothetical protein
MPNNQVSPVSGIDGKIPVYDPEGSWRIWSLDEIWSGPTGPGEDRFVPKELDYVIDPPTYTTYIVDHLDPISLTPTLREIRPSYLSGTFSDIDILFGVGPGTQADTYRIYIDKSVTPFNLAVDNRLKIAGSMCSYCKIFKGGDLTNAGNVVSMVYDNNGNFVSNNVPLEIVAIDNHTNYFIKTVAACKTTFDLLDGEVVTAVMYDNAGHVISKRQLLVENTSFIRSLNVSTKYITHISLKSPFIPLTNDHLIEFPLNVPVNALNMVGVVHYNDGSTLELPVDGTRFKMLGIDQYLSAIEGQDIDLVLAYALAPNEVSYGNNMIPGYITESYVLRTVNPNFSYSVKLFCYPEWVNDTYGYKLNWFLLNLDRNVMFEVTNHIQFNPATGTFDPLGYGVTQRKSVAVNLKAVSPIFEEFLHTQLVDISLYASAPTVLGTAWTVAHEANGSRPAYGVNILAKKKSTYVLNIDAGINNYNDWLEHVYKRTYPLINSITEIQPPNPTHVQVRYGLETIEIPVANWNQDITFTTALANYGSVFMTFIRRIGPEIKYLAVASMFIKE